LDALNFSDNSSLGYLSENASPIVVLANGFNSSQVFTDSSTPLVVNNAGDFSGALYLNVESGSFNLPNSSTADLIFNGVVPEPGTLAIAAAALLLLFYVKRLRRA
jgi:hypothetical protein